MAEIIVEDPENMNLLGLILKTLLDINLQDKKKLSAIKNFKGTFSIQGAKMQTSILIDKGQVTIKKGLLPKASATIKGKLDAFLKMGTGEALITPVLTGKVRVWGNPFALLKLIKILKV